MSSVLKALGVSALVVALGGIGQPAQASPCLTFAGLQHCPVGGASLSINQGQLMVAGTSGVSGVSIATPGATAWSGESLIKLRNGAGDVLKSSSISQGQVTSSTQAHRVVGGHVLSATFTASGGTPTFRAQVYRDGVLQGTSTGNPSGSNAAVMSGPVVLAGWEDLKWPSFIVAAGGSCTWVYRTSTGGDREITLANGQTFLGDEIRFAEEVQSAGAYPYLTFDGLVFEGNLQGTKFTSETVK